jgi:hypothetical protein
MNGASVLTAASAGNVPTTCDPGGDHLRRAVERDALPTRYARSFRKGARGEQPPLRSITDAAE